MSRVVCPGSFDPVHNGHLGIIERAARLFDEVLVAVSTNRAKTYRFSTDERLTLCTRAVEHLPNVRVLPMGDGLLAEFCRDRGANAVVKGLRSGVDLDYELPMATMNRHLADIDTLFLPTDQGLAHLSSTLIKEVAALGGDIDPFVPGVVLSALLPGARENA